MPGERSGSEVPARTCEIFAFLLEGSQAEQSGAGGSSVELLLDDVVQVGREVVLADEDSYPCNCCLCAGR